jgi:hypothetical protein
MNQRLFRYEIVKTTRGLENHPYQTQEVVGKGHIILSTYGYSNPLEPFWKWASKEQREYTKQNQTNAMDSFHFREWSISQEEE